MDAQDAIDVSREAIKVCLMVGGPILLAGLLIGLLVGIFQSMTQIQDQSVSFVPKLFGVGIVFALCLPWCSDHLFDFAESSFGTPMVQTGYSPEKKNNQQTTQLPKIIRPAGFVSSDDGVLPQIHSMPSYQTSNQNGMPKLQPRPEFKFEGSGKLHPSFDEPSSPFVAPSYRISETPKSDISG